MPTNKYFKCPYCNKKFIREKLVDHIASDHANLLPEGFTPLRMVFHVVNRKPLDYTRPCRICKGKTDWDEKKGRYNFLCNNPNCKTAWIKIMKNTMGDKMGSNRPTATAEGLEKMLANRKISGKYKFSDGTIFTYTGSYELNCLKFMDNVLEIKSEDLQVPGPIIHYEYKGQTHIYIPDFYYIPYNLIIEVKDGGDNPNNRTMIDYRAKQLAKEKTILEKTNYNYIRLTNNNFGQLLQVFADLKMHLLENDTSKVAHVNESMAMGAIAPMVGFGNNDIVVVNRGANNAFNPDSDFMISNSPKLTDIIYRDQNGILKNNGNRTFIHDNYKSYIVKNKKDKISESIINHLNQYVDDQFIYETVFRHKCYSSDQIQFESNIKEYDYYQDIKNIQESTNKLIFESDKSKYEDMIKEFQSNLISPIEDRWGIISDNGAYNCCVKIKNYDKPMRGRSSMIIIREIDHDYKVFFKYDENEKEFHAPGGGWNPDEDPMDAAIREAEEEAHIKPKNVEFCGVKIEYYKQVKDWVKQHVANPDEWWYGYYSEIFVGTFDSFYKGHIEKEDEDSYIYSGDWFSINDIIDNKNLYPEYRDAIKLYLRKRGIAV